MSSLCQVRADTNLAIKKVYFSILFLISCSFNALNWKKFWLMTEERPQRMEGFPLDAICADYRTGRHFYDGEATMPEEEGDGVRDFFRNALKQHEMRNKIEK